MATEIHGPNTVVKPKVTIIRYYGGNDFGRSFDFIARDENGAIFTSSFTEDDLVALAKSNKDISDKLSGIKI